MKDVSADTPKDITWGINNDIEIGEFRPIDLALAPFNFPIQQVFWYSSRLSKKTVEETKSVVSFMK
jgi:hypothetical protein